MNVKTFLTGVVALAAMTQVASAQSTGDFRSNVGASPPYYWSNSANWERYNGSSWAAAAAAPDSTNAVTIQSGDEITVNAAQSCDHLKVESTGTLKVLNDSMLTIDGTNIWTSGSESNSTIYVAGSIVLGDAGNAKFGIIKFDTNSRSDHTLMHAGSASIKGVYTGSKLQIVNGVTVYSLMRLEGIMKIEPFSGNATLVNQQLVSLGTAVQGEVLANAANGTLELATGLYVADARFNPSNLPSWKVLSSGAVLIFNEPSDATTNHPRLFGNFVVDAGTGNCCELRFASGVSTAVETLGTLTQTNGKVTTNGSGNPSFTYLYGGLGQTTISDCQGTANCSCP